MHSYFRKRISNWIWTNDLVDIIRNFSLRIRSAAVSIGTLANFISNLLVALLFEAERVSFGESLLFGQFAFIAAAATWFTSSKVFETRGLSLEEIEGKLKMIVDGNESNDDNR